MAGRIAQDTGGVASPFAFTGREFDAESGLYFYRLRYYNAVTGRFLQEDPIGFGAGDANVYRYVFNNPVNLIDPAGLDTITIGFTVRIPILGGGKSESSLKGRGFSGGIAFSFPGLTGGEFDFGVFGTLRGGGKSFGTGLGATVDLGINSCSVRDLSGPGADINILVPTPIPGVSAGGTLNVDADGNITGFEINVGEGINVSGAGTITGTLSVRDVAEFVQDLVQ